MVITSQLLFIRALIPVDLTDIVTIALEAGSIRVPGLFAEANG